MGAMQLMRLIMVVAIMLSTSLSGAIAADHPTSTDAHAETATPMSVDHGKFCDDSADRSAGCHVMPAIVPALAMHGDGPGLMQTILFRDATLLVGTDPATALDPPRAV